MIPPSARAKKIALDIQVQCANGDGDDLVNMVARALDAERHSMAEQAETRIAARMCSSTCPHLACAARAEAIQLIRALAEEEA